MWISRFEGARPSVSCLRVSTLSFSEIEGQDCNGQRAWQETSRAYLGQERWVCTHQVYLELGTRVFNLTSCFHFLARTLLDLYHNACMNGRGNTRIESKRTHLSANSILDWSSRHAGEKPGSRSSEERPSQHEHVRTFKR